MCLRKPLLIKSDLPQNAEHLRLRLRLRAGKVIDAFDEVIGGLCGSVRRVVHGSKAYSYSARQGAVLVLVNARTIVILPSTTVSFRRFESLYLKFVSNKRKRAASGDSFSHLETALRGWARVVATGTDGFMRIQKCNA